MASEHENCHLGNRHYQDRIEAGSGREIKVVERLREGPVCSVFNQRNSKSSSLKDPSCEHQQLCGARPSMSHTLRKFRVRVTGLCAETWRVDSLWGENLDQTRVALHREVETWLESAGVCRGTQTVPSGTQLATLATGLQKDLSEVRPPSVT